MRCGKTQSHRGTILSVGTPNLLDNTNRRNGISNQQQHQEIHTQQYYIYLKINNCTNLTWSEDEILGWVQ